MRRWSVIGAAPSGLGLTAAAIVLGSALAMPAEAKSTRTFSGSNPSEVVKNARQAGYDYPVTDMECSSRCNQRWAKE